MIYGILMFTFQIPSRRKANKQMTQPTFKNNLRLVFPELEDLPHADTFNTKLTSYVLYLYTHGHMTQPLILEHLLDLKIDISSGKINNIINENKDDFHAGKDEILRAGLEVSSYINVDDTGARHKGKNGYCTHIGNELFAWFKSTESKSRINFFELLRAENKDYVLCTEAFDYMGANKLPKVQLESIKSCNQHSFKNEEEWNNALEKLGFTKQRHILGEPADGCDRNDIEASGIITREGGKHIIKLLMN